MTSEAARIEHWDYKLEGWDGFRTAQPNAVHHAIVRLEKAGKVLSVVTQNIDGLHALAGTSPERLLELHGTNLLVECQSCRWRGEPEPHFEFFRTKRKPPLCECGGFLKPATISFGQSLDPQVLERAAARAMETDLVVALGSTLSVYPAAGFPLMAAERGVPLRHHQSRRDGTRRRPARFSSDRRGSERDFSRGGRDSARLVVQHRAIERFVLRHNAVSGKIRFRALAAALPHLAGSFRRLDGAHQAMPPWR